MKLRILLTGLLMTSLCGTVAPVTAEPLNNLEKLGKSLYFDKNLSMNKNQSCATCHFPSAQFADPDNAKDPVTFPVSDGSDPTLFGGRNAPTAAYAGFSPALNWDPTEGLFIGGLFVDGRASGLGTTVTGALGAGPTYDPLADQAKGPFLNHVEMALGSEAEVVLAVQNSKYAKLFNQVFGPNAFADTGIAYNNIAIATAAFERSVEMNKFSSMFDQFVQEQGGDVSTFGVVVDPINGFRTYVGPPEGFTSAYFTFDQADGLALFNADSYTQSDMSVPQGGANGGMCYACHLTENDAVAGAPLFTDFSYDNLGIPVNPQIAVLNNVEVMPIDYGLGDTSRVTELITINPALAIDGNGNATDEIGKFRVSTLRGIAKTAPYGHNGFFATLKEIVHFYNDRQSFGKTPEVSANVNSTELGNLGLTPAQEAKIVLFMKTLTDQ